MNKVLVASCLLLVSFAFLIESGSAGTYPVKREVKNEEAMMKQLEEMLESMSPEEEEEMARGLLGTNLLTGATKAPGSNPVLAWLVSLMNKKTTTLGR